MDGREGENGTDGLAVGRVDGHAETVVEGSKDEGECDGSDRGTREGCWVRSAVGSAEGATETGS